MYIELLPGQLHLLLLSDGKEDARLPVSESGSASCCSDHSKYTCLQDGTHCSIYKYGREE